MDKNLISIPGVKMETGEEELLRHSQDASIFEVKPKAVIYPSSVEEIKKIVKAVAEGKKSDSSLSITARSAGTDMGGGPLNDSIILDFTRHFNHIGEIGDDWAETEPGVYYRDFEKATLAKGLLLPSYPASRELCTVGGMTANNSGGEKSLSYGKTENYVEELHMVLSDGEEHLFRELTKDELEEKMKEAGFEGNVYRQMFQLLESNYDAVKKAKPNVSKNSAGYYLWNVWDRTHFNLNKLIVGSQGTLGMITKIKFRLVRKNPHSELLVIFMNDLSQLGNLVDSILPYKPESFESYDDNTFKLAIKFFPELLKQMKGNLLKLGIEFIPELWLTATGGVPKLVLIAEFTGDTEEAVMEKLQEVRSALEGKFDVKCHLTRSSAEAQKYWVVRRESFNLLRKHIQGKHTAPFIDDIVVRPHDLPQFLPRLEAILDPYKDLIIYTIAGHAGDGNFHIIPLMNFRDPKERDIILSLSNQVYDLVGEFKGSITGEHNDGIIRTPYLGKMYGPEIIKLFSKVKNIFDPAGIFNPGKKVGGGIEKIVQYMKKE